MWYEVLPSFAVVFAAYAVPVVGVWGANKLFLGNAYKRDVRNEYDLHYYLRDMRLTGDAYKQQGLSSIPDE